MNNIKFEQRPHFVLDTSIPLADWLEYLGTVTPHWPDREHLLSLLGWLGEKIDTSRTDWYRKAWWGYYARRLLFDYGAKGKEAELVQLIDAVDTSEIDQRLLEGRGLILAGSHLGPEHAVLPWLRTTTYKAKAVTSNVGRSGDDIIRVSRFGNEDVEAQATALAKSLLHLRRGGVLRIIPDGMSGVRNNAIYFDIFNHRSRVARGSPELAFLSRAPVLLTHASWTRSARIKLKLIPIQVKGGYDIPKELWLRKWLKMYLLYLMRATANSPRDIGFGRGGLFWDMRRWW